MTDSELVQGVIDKKENAFRLLVEKYQQIVFNTCNGFLHNKEDAEDIAQDVFVEVYLSIDKFRHEAKLSTWLYRVAVNKSLNYIKKNKKNKMLLSLENIFSVSDDNYAEEFSKMKSNERNLDMDESAKILYETIDSLGENQRIAFTLNKFDDLSYKEIADIMDMSLSSVESLIHRAKINLQKKLGSYFK